MKRRFALALLLWIGMILLSVCLGRYPLSLGEIGGILIGQAPSPTAEALFYEIRLPRTVLVAVGGGALALSGLVFQTIFSNPLVSPDVLGVTSGCSVGAVFALLYLPASAVMLQGSSFLCGIGAVIFSLWLSRFVRSNRVLGMVLAGIVVGSVSSSILMIFKVLADPNHQLPAIEYWLMGGFQNGNWSDVASVAVLVIPCSLGLYLFRFRLKVLSLGDDQAQSLGVSPGFVRVICIGAATVLVSAVVSVAGVVSWIGLIAPHLIRLWGAGDVTKNMGTCFFAGGALLLAADLCARSLSTIEIPISIFTSLFGAAFLAVLLVSGSVRRKGGI
ncbi:MAG: FecCD family ABC transporter permease [Massiliimalia sp.]|jgi:iron complex transport system permease protein